MALTAAPKQVAAATRIVRRFLWHWPGRRAAEIGPAHVSDYLSTRLSGGASAKTIHNHCSAIRRFFGFLCERGYARTNPAAGVSLPRLHQRVARFLDDDELAETLRLARRLDIYAEVALAAYTGLRLSEIIRLQWPDVDLPRRQLLVRIAKSRRPRTVPLCRPALAALRLQRRRTGRMLQVFPSRQTYRGGWCYVDRPRAANWWHRAIRPIQQGVSKFRSLAPHTTGRGWHLLRHTFASRAVQSGVSLYKLAAWLGHSDVRTTALYAHLQAGYDPDVEAVAGPARTKRRSP